MSGCVGASASGLGLCVYDCGWPWVVLVRVWLALGCAHTSVAALGCITHRRRPAKAEKHKYATMSHPVTHDGTQRDSVTIQNKFAHAPSLLRESA